MTDNRLTEQEIAVSQMICVLTDRKAAAEEVAQHIVKMVTDDTRAARDKEWQEKIKAYLNHKRNCKYVSEGFVGWATPDLCDCGLRELLGAIK